MIFKLGRAMSYFTQPPSIQKYLNSGKADEGSAVLRMRKCHMLWETVEGGEDRV